MAAIKRYLVGKNVTKVDIIPQDISAAGVLTTTATTADALASLLGRFKSFSVRNRTNSEMIMSVDDVIENNVPVTEGYSFEITEILTQLTGTGGMATSAVNYEPVLPYLFNKRTSGVSTYDYFKVIVIKGGKTYTHYGLKQELTDGKTSAGEETATMSFIAINCNFDASGVASIAYT